MSPQLQAVVAHLWDPSQNVLVTTRREPFPAYREIESYLVVPRTTRAQFVVPLVAGRRVAAATTLTYNQLRPARARLLRAVVAAGVRGGILPMRSDHRLRILVNRDLPDAELPAVSPTHWLAALLNVDQVTAAFSVPDPTPNAKPTLQLFSATGTPVAYAKLSWNDSTRAQVRNEAAGSARFGSRLHQVRVPAVLHSSTWRGFDAVVTAPMPRDAVAWGVERRPPPLSVTEEIAGIGVTHSAGDSPVARRVAELVESDGSTSASELRGALRHALAAVTERWGSHRVRHGAWHGDWVPWNLARAGNEIIAWDWEHSSDDVPVGFDLLHWHFQVAFIAHRRPLRTSFEHMLSAAQPAVADLQGTGEAVRPAAALYTLELAARYLAMYDAGAGWNPRLFPDLIAVLGSLAED
jgi:hypothetical protein